MRIWERELVVDCGYVAWRAIRGIKLQRLDQTTRFLLPEPSTGSRYISGSVAYAPRILLHKKLTGSRLADKMGKLMDLCEEAVLRVRLSAELTTIEWSAVV